MAYLELIIAFLTFIALCSTAPAPAPEAEGKILQNFLIETIALDGRRNQVSGLYVEAYHSGAGQNNVNCGPIGHATRSFHYNKTAGTIYHDFGRDASAYRAALALDKSNLFNPGRFDGYGTATVNFVGYSVPRFGRWNINGATGAITPRAPLPSGYAGLAVCNSKLIAFDQPKSSYQVLTWYRDGADDADCTPVRLKMTPLYGDYD